MGIFGALTTSVTGMRAQSYALENISGNIANSQTTAFKRIDTSFIDLVPDQALNTQLAGNVTAQSRSTNSVQGDIQTASIPTFMAINGDGFFVVQKPSSNVDNKPVFSGVDNFTRRGDFQVDKNGNLVNGAGYYLMGIPVDPDTGNVVGSVPQVLQFKNDLLPAQETTQVDYRVNLPSFPKTDGYNKDIPNSELLNPGNFISNPMAGAPQAAKITGFGAELAADAPAKMTSSAVLPASTSQAGSFTINGTTINIAVGMTPAQVVAAINAAAPPGVDTPVALDSAGKLVLTSTDADTQLDIGSSSTAMMTELGLSVGITKPTNLLTQSAASQGDTLTIKIGAQTKTITFGTGAGQVSTLAELNSAPNGLGGVNGGIATADAHGNITVTATNSTDNIQISGTASAKTFGMQTDSAIPANEAVIGSDEQAFLDTSISGGTVTAYDSSGSPINIQLRWAKVDSVAAGGVDKWNLFYQVNSDATGQQVAWQNAGTNYTFGSNFQLNPPITNLTLQNVTIDGLALGDVQITHGSGGVTQFADANGTAQINLLEQNGFAAGELQSVSVSDKGRVVGSYSNGRTIDLAEITLANFNGPNNLKRIDGGAFETTDSSGPPIYGAAGKIVGSALEGSNTDIADEFTKLIVTQQAYSANTRVISTTNQMVQDLLNMLR